MYIKIAKIVIYREYCVRRTQDFVHFSCRVTQEIAGRNPVGSSSDGSGEARDVLSRSERLLFISGVLFVRDSKSCVFLMSRHAADYKTGSRRGLPTGADPEARCLRMVGKGSKVSFARCKI